MESKARGLHCIVALYLSAALKVNEVLGNLC